MLKRFIRGAKQSDYSNQKSTNFHIKKYYYLYSFKNVTAPICGYEVVLKNTQ